MHKHLLLFTSILTICIIFSGIYTDKRRIQRPSYAFWVGSGSKIKIKPKYGRQLMPDRELTKISENKLLLFSNSPETLRKESLPCLIYKANANNKFRLLLHHRNGLGYNAFMNIKFRNPNPKNIKLCIVKSSNCKVSENGKISCSKETISTDPALAGRNAFIRWLKDDNKNKESFTIKPNENIILTFPFKNTTTLSSMSDCTVLDETGKETNIEVSVFVTKDKKTDIDNDLSPVIDPVVAEDPTSSRIRGIFDYTELNADFTYRLSETSYCEIGSASEGIYSFPNPGEYRMSLKAKDMYLQKDTGNFGVCYKINMHIINDLDTEGNAFILASAAGGRSLVVLKNMSKIDKSQDDIFFSEQILDSTNGIHEAWIFDHIKIDKGKAVNKTYFYTLPCGCNGPVRFYVVSISNLNSLIR